MKLIPPEKIDVEAKHIAIAWVENFKPHSSIMPEIAQKQKLASDIQNFAISKLKEALKKFPNDGRLFVYSDIKQVLNNLL